MVGNSKDTLRGISQIINPQNAKRNMNYEEIEKNLTRNGLIVEDKDPTELFQSRLNELAKTLNVSLGTPTKTVSARAGSERRTVAFSNREETSNRQQFKSYVGSSIGPRKPMSNSAILLNSGMKYGTSSRSPLRDENENSESDDDRGDRSGDRGDRDDDRDYNRSGDRGDDRGDRDDRDHNGGGDRGGDRDHNSNSGSDYSDSEDDHRDNRDENNTRENGSARSGKTDFPNFDYSIRPNTSSEFGRKTQEERIHNQVREVINDMGGDNGIISLENARKEDEKICMLEEIDSLKQGLEEEGTQGLDKIPRVTEDSSYEMVENVLKRLRLKNDRSRYTSLADEFILWGASALEDLFDGKRSWFGKKPDLTGWSKEVQVKLRRMHHDTSTLISGIMHDFNIGPATRVVLELVPNCVMYARRKKINHGKPDIFESEDISNSINNIRNFD